MSEQKNSDAEVTLPTHLNNLLRYMLELDYHLDLTESSRRGLNEVLAAYNLCECESCAEGIAVWASRLTLALTSLSQVAHDVASEANVLFELTDVDFHAKQKLDS